MILKSITISLFVLLLCARTVNSSTVFSKRVHFNQNKIQIKTDEPTPERPRIGLVLSGGGSRGMAHIGVLQVLEDNEIPIDLIIGSSIGSVIGGMYASGYTCEEMISLLETIDWADIYRDDTQRTTLFPSQKNEKDRYLFSIRFNGLNPYIPSAFTPGHKVMTFLSDLVLKAKYQARSDFDNLKIPFRAVSTDLVSGKLIVLKQGNLAEAINASLAVPLLFSPVSLDTMLLVDGGLLSNLPVDVAKNEGMDVVIAVDATARLRSKSEIQAPWEIVDQATTIMSSISKEIQKVNADILIKPDLGDTPNDAFENIRELVEIGENAARQNLEQIQNHLLTPEMRMQQSLRIDSVRIVHDQEALDLPLFNLVHSLSLDSLPLPEIIKTIDRLIESGQYESVCAQLDTLEDIVTLSYCLQSFPVIRQITFAGVSIIPQEELTEIMFCQTGQRLNAKTLQSDLENILLLYRKQGYSIATIDEIVWNAGQGSLLIGIDEGVIERIEVQGNERTKNYVIAREFREQRGAVFNWQPIERSVQDVYATNLFDRVNVDLIQRDSVNDLRIKVTEKSPSVIHFGGKYDAERRIQAYAEFGYENLFGMGIRTNFLARMGMRDGYVGLNIIEDRVFTTNLTFALRGYYSWEINPLRSSIGEITGRYNEERRGVRLQVGTQIRRLGQLVAEIRQENVAVRPYSGIFTNRQQIDIRTLVLWALSDKRDRIDFPTEGIYNHWSWESGNRLLLDAKESFTKALINLEGFYTFRKIHTWRLKFTVGIGDRTVPFSENFRLGGLHNFFGLLENEYYGRQMVVSNIEYRYRTPLNLGKSNLLINDTYLLVRYDFGGIWNDPQLVFTSDDFFSALGGALALDTFLGPFYLGYGRTTRGVDALYISIGFNF